MIRKIRVRGFKKFADQEFDVPGHLVVVGPNNSGKTSLLQAVGAWMEVASRWSQRNPDLAREDDGNWLYAPLCWNPVNWARPLMEDLPCLFPLTFRPEACTTAC